MQNKKLITLSLIIILAISILAIYIPQANAAKKSYAIVGAVPNPIGVNQETLIAVGITEATQATELGWKGLTVTVTRPDGTNETLGPFDTDSTGATGTVFIPTMVGNYTLQSHFPGQWENYTGVGFFGPFTFSEYYEASDSAPLTLIVQEEPIKLYPGNALPGEYWTRPIDSQLREWYTLAGSWLYTPANNFAPYNFAPESAHVLWTEPLTLGGLVGGDYGLIGSGGTSVGMGIGDAYEGKWSSRIILDGRLYYSESAAGGLTSPTPPVTYHCVDLRTGEEYWQKEFPNNASISFGQLLYWQSMNYQGTYGYLYEQTGGASFFGPPAPAVWTAFDAYTGNWRFTINNVPAGTLLRDDRGALYILQSDLINGWMALWNMSAFCTWGSSGFNSASWGNSVNGQTFTVGNDARSLAAYSWNKTIPKTLEGSVVATFFGDRMVGSNVGGGFGGAAAPSNVAVWAVSLKQGQEGTVLFNTHWTAPSDWTKGNQSLNWAATSQEDEMGVIWAKETRTHYGVSFTDGKLVWGPSEPQYYMDIYEGTQLTSHFIAYNKLYASGVSGILYCYDVKTGDSLWQYAAQDPYTEMLWNNNWWLSIPFISDGKVYIGSGEHSPNQPLPRGAPFGCVNATDGTLIWRINGMFRQTGWGGNAIIGDSVIATMDTYDQRVYAIGKGPSAMTAEAPLSGVQLGNSVTLRGTITDISPGTNSQSLSMRFPNGVPAVSDESMSDWMLYVYKQFAKPANATGLTIDLSVVDGNGNYREIGTTTSDADGFFSYNWTPDIEGSYTVYASFGGSAAYYPSHAVTAFSVDQAPTPAPTAEPVSGYVTASDLLTYLAAGVIAIIIAIAIATLLIMRKH
ncbi:MAG: PQQ-binding-like beta-propeller repeat protein [Candidatus Bathyarchaeota archaeon]|nr:PQQ-binding-like beta-propeller repeat protein [Candidatus Bathyarchaeota archaeon]